MIKEQIKISVQNALEALNIEYQNIIIQEPRNHKDVDYATNIALMVSKQLTMNPMDAAEKIVEKIKSNDKDIFNNISIAKPGFINFTLNPIQYLKRISLIIEQGEHYGKSKLGANKTALVEFVSANPTGPLTIGHGRGAIIGEFASTILDWNGFNVEREYYFNNAGRQMRKLAESVHARYLEKLNLNSNFPEDGYNGQYIYNIAEKMEAEFSNQLVEDNLEKIKNYAEEKIFEEIKSTLKKNGNRI